MFFPKLVYTVFLVSLGYFLLLTVYYMILALIGSFEEARRALQGEKEDYSQLYLSPLKIPVSII